MKEFSWNLENLIALNDCGYATLKANCETQKIHKTMYMSIKSKICNNDEIEIIARKKEGSDWILFCGKTQNIKRE